MNNPSSSSTVKRQAIEVHNILTELTAEFPETHSENYQQVKNLRYCGQQR